MVWFFAGLATLVALVYTSSVVAKANPRSLATVLRSVGGILALLLAALLLLRGLIVLAIPLALAGAALLGLRLPFGVGNLFGGDARRSSGNRSEVKTSHIAMVLDHDSGRMEGRVVAGRFEGFTLDAMTIDELLALAAELSSVDPQGLRLLEAYLDRRDPEWQEREPPDQGARPKGGAMTRAEALDILGLRTGATDEDIKAAHRNLMKKLHPDHGGSSWIASRLNEAKDVLLGT